MTYKKGLLLTALSFLLNSTVFAENERDCVGCLDTGDIYLSLEAGASFSTDASMDVKTGPHTARQWDPAPEGYDSDLGTSEMLGAGVGYVINQLIMFEIEAAHRDSFEYQKFQTGLNGATNKTRYFDLENTTVIANLFLNGSGLSKPFAYRSRTLAIDPFVTGGIGVAFNTVTDFHTIRQNTGNPTGVMEPHTKTSFAFQLGAGINIRTTKQIGLSLGYRYLDAGTFESNNYTEASSFGPGAEFAPWKGKLRANEIYAALNYFL